MSEIVVTGLGWLTPLGHDLVDVFNLIYSGESGIQEFNFADALYAKSAGLVDYKIIENLKKEHPKVGKFTLYGMFAAQKALEDASLLDEFGYIDEHLKISIITGSAMGGVEEFFEASKSILNGNYKISPYFLPSFLINLLGGNIAIKHKIKGANQSQVTACATGSFAIADGARMIRENRCKVALVGASEASVCKIVASGFCALKALAKNNDSRPFDKNRSGFVLSEGAAMLVLEEKEHAIARGARIYCNYLEAGITNDAYHITSPDLSASGSASALKESLERSNLKASDIDYINAHATSTKIGDSTELKAIKEVFSDNWNDLAVSSIKGATGHTLGASGAIEAIATVLSLYHQKVLPTINLNDVDEEAFLNGNELNLVKNKGIEKNIKYAISNSLGFGGHNISLVFGL